MTGPAKKKVGAPKSNKNALKHGLYSRFHTREESAQLSEAQGSVRDEIDNLRVIAQRLNQQLKDRDDWNELFKCIQTLAKLSISIGSLEKVEAFLTGNISETDLAFQAAIESLKDKWKLA